MNQDNYSKNLAENEEILETVRQHPITLFGPFFFNGIIILVDFFFLTWFFAQKIWGVAVFFLLIIIPALILIRTYKIWTKNVFIISNKRVIDVDQHGLFHKQVSECNYEKIQDVSFTVKGVFATLFNFGKIEIQTAGNQANLEISFIKNPSRIQELITEQQRASVTTHKEVSDEDLEDAITKVKKRLDDKTLKKLFHQE